MLLFSDVVYMLARYASPSGPMWLRSQMLTLSGPVKLFCYVVLMLGLVLCYVGCL